MEVTTVYTVALSSDLIFTVPLEITFADLYISGLLVLLLLAMGLLTVKKLVWK